MSPDLLRRLLITASIILPFAITGCQTSAMLSIPGEARSESADDILRRLRENEGLPAMAADAKLERAAGEQARLMAARGKMEHTTGRGDDFVNRIRRNGVEGAAAENIARGNFDTERLFLAWMNSRGHRRNMLDERFTRFGLASAQAKTGERYWALVLAG
jgi:uncharacterized protein YkwD